MKIWPFDEVARANRGQYISAGEMRGCLEPFEKVRACVGDRMEIMVELHGLWEAAPAIKDAEPWRNTRRTGWRTP